MSAVVDVMDAPMYSDRELRASVARAVTAERRRVLAEIRQMAREHGAFYFAEPRPCDCKPGCGTVTAPKMPFADVIPEK